MLLTLFTLFKKYSETIGFIAKEKIILCTGAVMEELAQKLLHLSPVSFVPEHAKKLANEFKCYANYDAFAVI